MRRRRKGFVPLGELSPADLGLPARRAREMHLGVAWRKVAGEVLARNAPALRVRRGVLEVEAADRAWMETLDPLLPGLAAKLAEDYPDLGIRRCRLVPAGHEGALPPSRPIRSRSEPGPAGPSGPG